MAYIGDVALSAGSFVELSQGEDITAQEVTVQNRGPGSIILVATSDATPPTSTGGGFEMYPGVGGALDMAALFKGVTAPVRLWAYASIAGTASIQYA